MLEQEPISTKSFSPHEYLSLPEGVRDAREIFAETVTKVTINHRIAQRLASMWIALDYIDGTRYSGSLGPGDFADKLLELGVTSRQLVDVFHVDKNGNPNESFIENLMGFKETGKQALADLLGKPIQFGWYDGFYNNDPYGDIVSPKEAEEIDQDNRIWITGEEKLLVDSLKKQIEPQDIEDLSHTMLPGNSFNERTT